MALAHCTLGKFLGVDCYCFPPPLDVPTFSTRCLHVQRRERPLAAEGGILRGQKIFRQISSRIRLPRNSRNLLHAANLRHGTDGFTSEDVYPLSFTIRLFLLLHTCFCVRVVRQTSSVDSWASFCPEIFMCHLP
jgi:hypothetical protein